MIRQLTKTHWLLATLAVLAAGGLAAHLIAAEWSSGKVWPEPKVIDPGRRQAPSDAHRALRRQGPVAVGRGRPVDRRATASPRPQKTGITHQAGLRRLPIARRMGRAGQRSRARGQGRGNSGVFLMGRYEVQVLDSYDNKTYFDGQCGVDLQAIAAAGECLPQAGRMADLRHHLRRPRSSTRGQRGPSRPRHRAAKRRAGAGPFRDRGRHVLRSRPPAYAAHAAKLPHRAPIPRQPGPLPQHLDPGAAGEVRRGQAASERSRGAGYA